MHLIAEPWASSLELTTALCIDCHREVENHPERNDSLRVVALQRLSERYSLTLREDDLLDPLATIRRFTDLLDDAGYHYDSDSNRIESP